MTADETTAGHRGAGRRGWRSGLGGELAAEFLGTFVLILFGCGSVAMAVAALNQSGRGEEIFIASGDWLLICWGWGMGVMLGVYVAGGVSTAHLNPAVTIAMAARRGFPAAKVLPYSAAQLLGAFAAAALIYANYHGAIESFESAQKIVRDSPDGAATFGIFATGAAPYYDNWFGPFLDEVIGTALLVAAIFAFTDDRNQPPGVNIAPLIIGLLVFAIGIAFGANSGYAINPARDLGPRVLAWLAGWGENAVPGKTEAIRFYAWIPIIGPIIGGLIGAVIYDKLIRDVLLARARAGIDDTTERETDQ